MTDWQTIVSRHSEAVWRTAYRLLGNEAEAADCFQETFVSALGVSRREPVRNWSALLQRVATTRAMDRLRSRLRDASRQGHLADWSTVPSPNPGPVQEAEAAELSGRLRRALADLPDGQAEIFCLRCLNQLSYRQIARQVGTSTAAVGISLYRTRRRLRELLTPPGGGSPEVSP